MQDHQSLSSALTGCRACVHKNLFSGALLRQIEFLCQEMCTTRMVYAKQLFQMPLFEDIFIALWKCASCLTSWVFTIVAKEMRFMMVVGVHVSFFKSLAFLFAL